MEKKNIGTKKFRGGAEYVDLVPDRWDRPTLRKTVVIFGNGIKLQNELVLEKTSIGHGIDPWLDWTSQSFSKTKLGEFKFKLPGFPAVLGIKVGDKNFEGAVSTYGVDRWGQHLLYEESFAELAKGSMSTLSVDWRYLRKKAEISADGHEFLELVKSMLPEILEVLKKYADHTGCYTNSDLYGYLAAFVEWANANRIG